MTILDRASGKALIGLIGFLAITTACTGILAMLLSNASLGSHTTYKAVFSDVTGVFKGDDVRIAGVVVGNVKKAEIYQRDKALVTFEVKSDIPLTKNTNAALKYRNLVGQRYLTLSQGPDGAGDRLHEGDTIGPDQTKEALDLNVLLNGFKPVFEALDPDQTNQLAAEIVKTLQGESESVESLLSSVSSLTNTLAGRDELIGDVINNLSNVLDTVGSRDAELGHTIDTLQELVTGLKDDRGTILDSIDGITGLTSQTSDLLEEGRPALVEDIKQLRTLSDTLAEDDNRDETEDALKVLPIKMKKLGRAASYGSEFNFYLCGINGQIELPEIPPLLDEKTVLNVGEGIDVGGARCEQ